MIFNRKKKHIYNYCYQQKKEKKNKGWINDSGTEAELKKVLEGNKYKVTTLEIIHKKDNWYIHLSFKYEKQAQELDKNNIVGIDLGLSNPLVCAIYKKYERLSIQRHSVMALTRKQLSRLRNQWRGGRFRRGGHGKEHKFALPKQLSKKYILRRRSIMEEWVSRIVKFALNNNAGTVHMEKIDAEIKDGQPFLETVWQKFSNVIYLKKLITLA